MWPCDSPIRAKERWRKRDVDLSAAGRVSSLLWKNHIEYTHKKLLRFVGIFYKLRYKLNPQVLKHFIFFILIRFYVEKKTYCTPTVELYKQYDILPVPDLHVYQLLVHRFLCYKHKLSEVFSKYFTLNRSIHNYTTRTRYDLHLPSPYSSTGKKIIKFKASQL